MQGILNILMEMRASKITTVLKMKECCCTDQVKYTLTLNLIKKTCKSTRSCNLKNHMEGAFRSRASDNIRIKPKNEGK